MDFSSQYPEADLTFSETAVRKGIDNTIPAQLKSNGIKLSNYLAGILAMWKLDKGATARIMVTSGFRCPALNVAIGGAKTSDHCLALAADLRAYDAAGNRVKPYDFATWLSKKAPNFKQIIHEFGQWVHIAIPGPGVTPKMELLTAKSVGGKTQYELGIKP